MAASNVTSGAKARLREFLYGTDKSVPLNAAGGGCLCGEAAIRRDAKSLLDDAEDFFFAHDQEFVAVELDLGARVLAEEDGVAGFDVEREDFAFVVGLALANRLSRE
jgi:hypothetical protein